MVEKEEEQISVKEKFHDVMGNSSYSVILYALGENINTAVELSKKLKETKYKKERSVISRQLEILHKYNILDKLDKTSDDKRLKDISFKGDKKFYCINYKTLVNYFYWKVYEQLNKTRYLLTKNGSTHAKNLIKILKKDKISFLKNPLIIDIVKSIIYTGNLEIYEGLIRDKERKYELKLFSFGEYLNDYITNNAIRNEIKIQLKKNKGKYNEKDIEYFDKIDKLYNYIDFPEPHRSLFLYECAIRISEI